MKPFTTLRTTAAALKDKGELMVNVDTDMIVPKQFLKTTERVGLSEGLFYELKTLAAVSYTHLNIIQPVVITTVQPIEYIRVNEKTENITNAVRYEETVLDTIVEEAVIPETQVNYIPQVTEEYQEERSETYFEAVVQRDIYQPVVRTIIQPVEVRRVNAITETVNNPTRYETVRASLVVLNLGSPCNCD